MERSVLIDGKSVKMRASALIPRLYRFKFGRDLVSDMNQLRKSWKRVQELPADATDEQRQDAQLDAADLTIFENVAYLMAKNAGEPLPDTPDEWLDGMDGVFSVYEVLPVILELWGQNLATTSTPKKNNPHRP